MRDRTPEPRPIDDTWRSVVDAIPDGIVVWRADGSVCFANARAAEIAGRPIAPDVSLGVFIETCRLLCAGSSDLYRSDVLLPAGVFEGHTARFSDAEFECPDGRRHAVEGSTSPVRAMDGTISFAVTAFTDVTARRSAEALRAGEARVLEMVAADRPLGETLDTLARVFEAQADGMLASILLIEDAARVRHAAAPSLPPAWTALVDGEPIGLDRGSCGTAAYLREQVIVTDIAVDPRWALYREVALQFGFRACWSTPIVGPDREVLGTFAFYYFEPREPTPWLLELAAHASRLATVAIQRHRNRQALVDITHVKDAERRLTQVSERLQMATRAANLGIWVWNLDDNSLEWDEVMHRLYEVTPSGIVPHYETWKRRVHPDDLARMESAFAEALRVGARVDTEFRVVRPDGTCRHLEVSAVVQHDAEGRPRRVVGTNRDVTEAREAGQVLQRAKDAAEAATRAKSLFLANMSHEIRTPLNAILGYAQLLQRDASLGPEQRYRIDAIHTSGCHLLMLINDILEMSKIEAGRTTLLVEPFDLHALLGGIRLMFAELTAAKGLELAFDLHPDLTPVAGGDAGKIRQVVINLLSNAIKFTDCGRVTLRASSNPVKQDRHIVKIKVEDTGIGIKPDDQSRIFGAFDQSEPGVRSGGTGLGLAISRHFAQLMDGDLTVDSTVGEGSTFTFTFTAGVAEVTDVPVREAGPMPTRLLTRQDSRKLLIVDDVATNRDLLEDLLSKIGFDTRVASSGEEAIRVDAEWRPDLVLMDLRMPGIGGLEATRRLRARGTAATIFAITASGFPESEQEALSAGADAFLRKPYAELDLLARIGRALGVRYAYARADWDTAVPGGQVPALSDVLRGVPTALVAQLREAAIQGRSSRLERLAEQVREYSEAGAAQVRTLAREFRYDSLLDALDKETPQS